jgi:hypothetical protein
MKAKVFRKVEKFPLEAVHYCVDGMHVCVGGLMGAVVSREVVACNGACNELPTLQELEFTPEALAELKPLLNQGVQKYSLPM